MFFVKGLRWLASGARNPVGLGVLAGLVVLARVSVAGDMTSLQTPDVGWEKPYARFSDDASRASYATSAGTAGYATSAGNAGYATSAGTAGYATSAGNASHASNADKLGGKSADEILSSASSSNDGRAASDDCGGGYMYWGNDIWLDCVETSYFGDN